MVGLYKGLQRFRRCETGAVISAELVIVGTVMVAGLATGWAALQQSVVSELRDFSEAISALDQTYSFAGHRLIGPCDSCLASSAGSRYVDTQILCDEAQPAPMSECCLSPVIVHDTTRPGHWHCDRCGHQHQPQHQPQRQPANQPPQRDAVRGGSRQPAGPPPVPPVPPDHPRARVQPQADRQPSPPRPEPDPGPAPSRRPGAPARKGERSEGSREAGGRQPERGRSGDGDSPFTPRENAPARSQKTSEGDSDESASGESNDITQSEFYMLAQLPLQEPFVPPHAPAPIPGSVPPHAPVPPHAIEHHGSAHAFPPPVPEHPGVVPEHAGPIHEHAGPPVVHGVPDDGYPYSEHGYGMAPQVVHPRYEYRGHREPISTLWGHGPGVGQRSGYRSGGCGGCGRCGGCAGVGSIRPGVEYYSGVRKVRVMEIPLSGPEPVPQAYGVAPYVPGPHPGFAVPAYGWPSGYRVNRHEPRFPDYVWQPVWQVVW